jgi:transposase
VKPLSHRSNRSVSVTERKPYTVVSNTHRYLTGLDKLPSNRYIYRLTEPSEGPSLEGCRVKKPAGTITLSSEEGEGLIAQVHQSNLPAAVAGKVEQIIRMYFWVVFALQEAKLSVKRLRNLLFGSRAQPKDRPASEVEAPSSEAPRQAAGAEEAATVEEVAPCLETTGCEAGSGASENEAKPKPKGGHRAGTGRLGADAYVGAKRTECRHEDLAVGQRCPVCGQGTLYALPSGVEIRIDGHALLSAMRYELQKLRCSACGQIFTAPLPRPAGEEKYSARARAVLAVSRYYLGIPGYRLQGYQAMLGVPVPDATQWDEIEKVGDCAYVVFAQMEQVAAQGELIWQDDTAVRILSLMQENLELIAAAQAHGLSTPKERTGMHTTALVVKVGEHTAILYYSSRRHAGENLQALLDQRAAGLDKPLAMSDALSSNEVAQEAALIRCHCLAHGRRKFSDLAEVFPHECKVVLEVLRQVFDHDEQARQAQLSPEARLAYHQEYSQPLMDGLKGWLATQMDEHLVEPNGSLGKAMVYMQRHWETLTRFLSVPGAPIDNNLAERVLKLFIRQRKNSLFYKSTHSAYIASVLTSLIATCLYAGVNAVEYLVALQEHRREVFADPAAWLPWAYASSRASP